MFPLVDIKRQPQLISGDDSINFSKSNVDSKKNIPKNSNNLPEISKKNSNNRTSRSTDSNSMTKKYPSATKLSYSWKTVERVPSKVVDSQVKIYKPTKRLETITRPDSPYRMNTSWQTDHLQAQNHKRAEEMKRLEWLKQHTAYTIYPYGDIEEKETYK
jgi:hypothetical protein